MNTSKLNVSVHVLPLGILLENMERLRRLIFEQVQGLQDELDKARAESAEWQAKYDALAQSVSSATPKAIEQQLQALIGTEVTVEYWTTDRDTGSGTIETVSGALTHSEYGWHVAGKPVSALATFSVEDIVSVDSDGVKPSEARTRREEVGDIPQTVAKRFNLSQDDCHMIRALMTERGVGWPSLVRQALEADGFTFPTGAPSNTSVCTVSLPAVTAEQLYARSDKERRSVVALVRNALNKLGLDLKTPIPGRPKGSLNRTKRNQ